MDYDMKLFLKRLFPKGYFSKALDSLLTASKVTDALVSGVDKAIYTSEEKDDHESRLPVIVAQIRSRARRLITITLLAQSREMTWIVICVGVFECWVFPSVNVTHDISLLDITWSMAKAWFTLTGMSVTYYFGRQGAQILADYKKGKPTE